MTSSPIAGEREAKDLIDAIYALDINNRSAKQIAVRILTNPQILLGALNGLDRQASKADACADSCAVLPAGSTDRDSLIRNAQAFLSLANDNALAPRVPSMAISFIEQLVAALLEPVGEGWQDIATAPEGESVLVYMAMIDAVDMAHMADTGRWISNGGTIWPPGVCTHWMPLPASPKSNGGMGS